MDKYINYCTEEQTIRLWNLSVPFKDCADNELPGHKYVSTTPYLSHTELIEIPTTQQVINLLEDIYNIRINPKLNLTPKGFEYLAYYYIDVNEYISMNGYLQGFNTRYEAELSAINSILDYLEKNKHEKIHKRS